MDNDLTLEKLKIDDRLRSVESDVVSLNTGLTSFKENHDVMATERQTALISRFDRLDSRISTWILVALTFAAGAYVFGVGIWYNNREYTEKNDDAITAKLEKMQDTSAEMISQFKVYMRKYQK